MENVRSEQLIRECCSSLIAAGMRPQYAARHRDRLRFFLHAYLAEEWPRGLDRVDGPIIRDYLGSWFINNVGGSKSDLLALLDTFTRFYEFLYQTGRISGPEHDDIIAVCAGRDYFMACHDERFAPEPDPWADLAAGRPAIGGDIFSLLPPGAAPDRRLWVIARNLERPPAPAVLDFSLFLDYLSRPIRLNVSGNPPLYHIRRINQRFTAPEELKPRKPMAACRRIAWFFNTALALGMARKNSAAIIEPAPGADAFLDLDEEQKIAVLLDGAWNRLRWAKLAVPENRRVSEWAQEHRDGFAALLADLIPDREWALDPDTGADPNEALLARYILFHEVVQTHVLFILRECGVLDCSAALAPGPGQRQRIHSVTMSRFGRQVMRLFARRGRRDGRAQAASLQSLQQNLLSSRPAR